MTIFAIAASPTFKLEVKVRAASSEPDGKPIDHVFVAEFKRMKRTEYNEFVDSRPDPIEGLKTVLMGWTDVRDASGADVPFMPESVDEYLDIPKVPIALWEAFHTGNSDAPIKN